MDLHAIRLDISRRLSRGVADRRSAFRTPALATASGARTVVLRSWDGPSRMLTIHSDVRAAKIAEVAAHPPVALHVWDAGAQVQLRLWGDAHRSNEAEADAAWARLHPGSRASYRAALVPGTVLDDPAALPLLDEADARQNFAVLAVVVHTMEWLHLAPDGHRRARFTSTPEQAVWLVP